MKRHISDLLDAYSDPNIEFEKQTPLSSERIKVLTMSKIHEEQKPRKRRITFRVLMAAAIIVTLAITVFAAGSGAEWFRAFFAKNSNTELSAGQLAYIDENAVELNQSRTVDGYTVTLESYISDGAKAYMKFRIQAPEGTELPKVIFGSMKPYHNGELIWGGVSSVWGRLDSGEEKRTGLYLLTMDGIPMDEDGLVLSLIDLHEFEGAGKLIAAGNWEFKLENPDSRAMELIEEPLEGVRGKTPEGGAFEATVTSACLRAMSLNIVYEVSAEDSFADHEFEAAKAIMKDGSAVMLNWRGSRAYHDDEGAHYSAEFEMNAPLDLDDVSCIEFPGGTQIPVNAAE